MRRGEIVGWGMYAPERVVSNDELAERVDTSDEWIRTRTGIARRHVCGEGETTSQMSVAAARAALQVADADPRDIDLIIVGTATPDHPIPSTACQVQNALGAVNAGAFDLNAGCSGFVYGLTIGHQAIASGECDLVLVIGADALTRVIDWDDRSTCVLFGDGAGAVLLRATEGANGILATLLGSDGSGAEALMVPAGGSAMPASQETIDQKLHYLRMNGRDVFRFASRIVPRAIRQVAAKANLEIEDIDTVLPHQANQRIIDAAAKRLKLPVERFAVNIQEYGNTSAASVPIVLCEAISSGRIRMGQNIVMVGFGAGLSWAAVALRWGVSARVAAAPFYRSWWRLLLYRWASLRTRVRRVASRLTVGLIRRVTRNNNHES